MAEGLRVALCQMSIRPARRFEDFAQHVERLVRQAASGGVDLIMLPEYATLELLATRTAGREITRADMRPLYRATFPPLEAQYVTLFQSLSDQTSTSILAGTLWTGEAGVYHNTAFLFRPGQPHHRQPKLHPTRPELRIDTAGGMPRGLVEIKGVQMGILVCYDIEFPEVPRALVLSGAELLLCPSLTFNVRGYWRVRYCAHARALENQVYVVVVPLVGQLGLPRDAPIGGTGRALVTCPIDNHFDRPDGVWAVAEGDDEQILTTTLDLERLHASRKHSEAPLLRHRRPELYEMLQRTVSRAGGDR